MLKDRKLQLVPFGNYKNFDQMIQEQLSTFQKLYNDAYKWQIMAESKEQNEIVITKSLEQFDSTMIQQIVDLQQNTNATTVILITYKPVKSQQQSNLQSQLHNVLLQCLTVEQLQLNISRHFLVPKHEKMSPQQVKQFLEQNHLNKNQLQQMLSTDAMGVYLGVRKGDVVKITRILDDTEYINYRIVI